MADDLFVWIDALWNKLQPEGTPPMFMIHRFVASDRSLAPAARYLQQDLRREPDIAFHTWQGLLPLRRKAPRLQYVAPKKPPEAEKLIARMMTVLSERRQVVEEIHAIFEEAQKLEELYLYFGIEPPEGITDSQQRRAPAPKRGGLLDGL